MIRIVVDSACDITIREAEELGIVRIPMIVEFGKKSYLDGVDLSNEEFFEKLIESSIFPHTSQIPPIQFEKAFEELTKNGDEVICITMSSKLSGTYQNASIASLDFEGVKVIDSLNVTCGEKIVVRRAMELIKEGKTLEEIYNICSEEAKNIALVALLDTLEYLKKGGRVSPTIAILGNMFHIKPVIEIKNGKVNFLGVARGSKAGNNKLREKIKEYGGIDWTRPVELAYSGGSNYLIEKYIDDSTDLYEKREQLPYCLIGPTIGTHIGPNAIAIAFYKDNKKK